LSRCNKFAEAEGTCAFQGRISEAPASTILSAGTTERAVSVGILHDQHIQRDELWMLRASIHIAEDLVQNCDHLLDLGLCDGQ
jgi:hypothetical protein